MAPNSNEVEQVVARTLRDSLVKLQQTTEELNQAVSDLVSACASSRPSNSLPSMLRARSAAASLAASLEVLSKFVVTALQASSPAETELLAMLPRAVAPIPQAEPPAASKLAPPEPAPSQALPPQTPPGQSVSTEPPVAESPESEPASPAEVSPPEVPISAVAKYEPSAPEPELIEQVSARLDVAQEIEKVEPLATRTPEPASVPAAPERPEEFTVAADSAESKPPILELPPFERPSPFETAFEPVVFEEPHAEVVEPVEVEPASKQETVAEAAPETAVEIEPATAPETAELYELATWKEPPSQSAAAPEAQPADREPPRAEEPVLEASMHLETRACEDPMPAELQVVEVPAVEAPADDVPEVEVSASSIDMDAAGLLTASTISGEMPFIQELPPEAKGFDVLSLSADQQELHRRANRVAKVSMQDVKMLRPRDVALGKENKDICIRLREDIEKAHKEYDRRFHAILDHPVDYFYDWMVEILGDGDPETLGDYPYPSPVLRR